MDSVTRMDRQVIDDRFRQTGTRNGRLLVLPSPHIGSTEWAKLEQLGNHNPPKPQEKRININPGQSPGKTGNVDSESAREQAANPPAGTALAPMPRCASAPRPSLERDCGNLYTWLTEKAGLVSPQSHLGVACRG
jgi:hypothetical protein